MNHKLKRAVNRERVTIHLVAKEAGVSASTVSRVLTGNSAVGDELRQSVLQAVEKLAYRPNQIARSLKVRETRTLGLLINDILNPFYSAVARGVEDRAREAGYSVIFSNTSEDGQIEHDALRLLHDKAVDGIILAPTDPGNLPMLEDLMAMGTHLVQIDRQLPQLKTSIVLLDNHAGSYQATQHLLERGHKRIGLINHISGRSTLVQREQGYLQAITDAGLTVDKAHVCHIAFDMSNLQESLERILGTPTRPTALFVTNNRLAIGVLNTIRKLHLRIPEDIALVMFDDLELFELLTPAITAVAQPAYAMGYKAADLLLEQLISDSPAPTQNIIFHPELIVRDSSGPRSENPSA